MAYKSTVKLNFLKQHVCSGCGTKFHYPMVRSAQAQASTADAAAASARTSLAKAIETETDPHPCPSCGIYQPEMAGKLRADHYGCLFLLLVVAVCVVPLLGLSDLVPRGLGAWIGAALVAVIAALHLRVASLRPNSDLGANAKLAEREIAAGKLTLVERGRAEPDRVPPDESTPTAKGAIALTLACLLLVPSAELARLVLGWPGNAGLYPAVVGPGEKATVYFDEMTSLKGYWRGRAQQRIENAAEVGLAPAAATSSLETKSDSWGGTIRAKSSEKSSGFTPWVKVAIPSDPALAGKTLRLALTLDVARPVTMSAGYDTMESQHAKTVSVTIAPVGAGGVYHGLWLAGVVGGGLMAIVLGFVISSSESAKTKGGAPTTIFPLPT